MSQYYYEDEIIGNHEDDHDIDHILNEIKSHNITDAVDDIADEIREIEAELEAKKTVDKLIPVVKEIVDNAVERDHKKLQHELVSAFTLLVVGIIEGKEHSKRDIEDDTFESIAKHLNYEQLILHKVAEVYGGKNKHPANMETLKKVYSAMMNAASGAKAEARMRRSKTGTAANHARKAVREHRRINSEYRVSEHGANKDAAHLDKVRRKRIISKWNARKGMGISRKSA